MSIYLVVAGRIRRELTSLERVVTRTQKGLQLTRQRPADQDFYFDSVALNLHDFYAGLERLFEVIATKIDGTLPAGREWHRELLYQMGTELSQFRPPVRNIYTFEFDPERLERLAKHLPVTFPTVQQELLAFADFLEQLARDDGAV